MMSLSGPLGPEVRTILDGMGERLAHRGPDDDQVHLEGPVGFAFRRLSIVDVAGGRQPLVSRDGSLVAMVNGEIYNHRELRGRLKGRHEFRTDSDSEIVVPMYEELGIDFLQHLNGMYGIALWDRRKQQLLLARDRLGIKPLHYAILGDRLIFASEIKALFADPACPRDFDWEAALGDPMDRAFARPDANKSSYFRGIATLRPGDVLVADARAASIDTRRYWSIPRYDEELEDPRTEAEIVDGYREIFEDAVTKCLMSDVEMGIFLSGGIDSVAIAGVASRTRNLHTFSVLSQSTVGNGDARAAHDAAKHLGLPNHQVLYEPAMPLSTEAYKSIVWACETPWAGPEQVYKIHLHRYARDARPGLKVILLGQGSDELNGGYSSVYAPVDDPSWNGVETTLRALERDVFMDRTTPAFVYMDNLFGRPLLSRDWLAERSRLTPRVHPWSVQLDVKLQHLPMYNLWHEDRTSSANSIESRVPFLDHRLVEYSMRVPHRHHAALFWDKSILRRACASFLPAAFCKRPKTPFFHGRDLRHTSRWMLGLLEANDGALLEEAFGGDTPIDLDAVRRILVATREDPEHPRVEELLHVVNMGLLANAARAASNVRVDPSCLAVLGAVSSSAWDDPDAVALRLGTRSVLDLDGILALPPDVLLLKPAATGDARVFVMMGGVVEFELDDTLGDWPTVLLEVDGKRSLRELLATLDVTEASIRKHLEEAIEYGVVSFRVSGS